MEKVRGTSSIFLGYRLIWSSVERIEKIILHIFAFSLIGSKII